MSKKIIVSTALVIIAFSVKIAFCGMDYPPEMMDVSAPYPNATITQTVKVPENVMVGMESNDSLDQIFEFYKAQLTAKGWTINTELKQQEGYMLVAQKDSKNVNIAIVQGGQTEITTIMMSLY